MKSSLLQKFLILFACFLKYASLISVPPTWITSNLLQADHKKIIDGTLCNCLTGNTQTPTDTFTFSNAFTNIPHLAFGIMSYQGNDLMSDEEIEVNRTNLLTTSFSVIIQIHGTTNLWILQVRYIAISKSFPHHFNNFDNVPINYTYGPLVNISGVASIQTTFTNIINYTLQAQNAGSLYSKFSFPLTNYKILLFLTSFSSHRTNPYVANSVYFIVDAQAVSLTQYKIKATLKQQGRLEKLHFSMIIFDEYDIQLSGMYVLKYEKINFTISAGFYQFPVQFLTNFMVGLTQYQSTQLRTLMNVNLKFIQSGSVFGVQKNLTSSINGHPSISKYIFTVFYLKTWYCPNETFYDHTTSMCIDCPLRQCILCLNSSFCLKCNTSNLFYLNGSTCDFCNSSLNTFINLSSFNCETCQLNHCLICTSLQSCQVCNMSAQYFLNVTDNLCYPCQIFGCSICSSLTTCVLCNQSIGYFLNQSNSMCQFCSLQNCLQCFSLFQCLICDTQKNFGLDYTSPNRSQCGPCNVSCTCDGYTTPWNSISQVCASLCGDGLVRLAQQCDDNNTDSGDGCSSSCVVQPYFICDQKEPTTCNQTNFIQAELISIIKHGCNEFKVSVKLTPNLSPNQITSTISFLNIGIITKDVFDKNGVIQIVAEYSKDIANQTINIKFSPGLLLSINYTPEIPALRYTEDECIASERTYVFFQAVQITSYIVLFFSLISCKIVGLQLFGVLQLSYFTLTMQDFFVIYLAPLAKFRTFNGLNIQFTKQQTPLPTNFTRLSVASSFTNNCNIMLILLFGQLTVSIVLYIIAKTTNRNKLRKISLRMLKQGFITLVIFNIFNISYSAGVHWKYASAADDGYILSSIILYGTLIAAIVATFAMCITDAGDYGQFKNKFKHVWICRAYIPLTILYRTILGLYTALQSDYSQGTLLIIGFAIAFMLYNIVNFPFYNTLQNYRATFIHITMFYTLLVSNYYTGMKINTPFEIKGRQYTVAIIQLILIIVSLGMSFITLIYEIYKILKQCLTSQRVDNQNRNIQYSRESIATQHNDH